MKKHHFGDKGYRNFWRRNGVYLVVTSGLVAVAAVLIVGTVEWMSETDGNKPIEEPVEQIVTGQPDDRTTATTTTTTTVVTTTTTTQEAPVLYVLPLTNTVQTPFSVDAPIYSETMKEWRIHSGVDFAGEKGQTVKATARGEVCEISEDPLWGWVITIDHGVGVLSRYCGVKPSVRVGDKVDASTPVGVLDEIPCESAQSPHLHFEMMVDGLPVNAVEAIALEVRYAETTE